MVLGGSDDKRDVELYSPNGKCQHRLQALSNTGYEVVLSLVSGEILACGGVDNRLCWIYVVATDEWRALTEEPNLHCTREIQERCIRTDCISQVAVK